MKEITPPSLSHPAAVTPDQHSASSQPSKASYNSHTSVHTWLERTTETSTATHTPSEHDVQAVCRKRKRSSPSTLEEAERTLTVPLTRKALKQHLASNMSSDQSSSGQEVFTPTKKATTTTSSYQTPTSASKSSKPTLPPNDVRHYMEAHRLFIEHGLLSEPELADFCHLVMNIANTERPSGRKPESERKWQNRMKKIHVHNEATMLDHILPLLIKPGRQVPVHPPDTQAEVALDQHVYHSMWEDFDDSGLDWTLDQEFAGSYLPNSYKEVGYDDEIAKILAKERGMKNPKPDRAYGLAANHIPPPKGQPVQLRDEARGYLNAIPGLHHAFFLIEGVRSAGNLQKAVNQACRGGTVAVRTQRLLLGALGQDTMREGPDRQTYVYTATVDDHVMSFWVNFAHVGKMMPSGQKFVNYHMEHIYSYGFRSPDAELFLRRVCHNILDWGVRGRRRMLEKRCSNMYQIERLIIDRDAAKIRAQATAAASAAATASAMQQQASGNKKRKLAPGSVSQGSH
ncbi:MAG: hypothetical protein Q9222_000819 [Ikaeria aurantiellina]